MSKPKTKPLFESPGPGLRGNDIERNISNLQHQIEMQFPDRGLSSTVQDLGNEAKAASDLSNEVGGAHPMAWFINITIPILVFVITLSVALYYLNVEDKEPFNGFDDIDGLINLVFLSVVIGVLIRQTVKLRRRNKAMKQLHQVRTLIHILDMKQQNKKSYGKRHKKEPGDKAPLSINKSILYLEDCSQAVVLAGKVAALLIEDYDDSLVIATVSEIDALCNGITNRIWLKILVEASSKPGFQSIIRSYNHHQYL